MKNLIVQLKTELFFDKSGRTSIFLFRNDRSLTIWNTIAENFISAARKTARAAEKYKLGCQSNAGGLLLYRVFRDMISLFKLLDFKGLRHRADNR